jgi:NADH-quinone oxidoreductase subunit K
MTGLSTEMPLLLAVALFGIGLTGVLVRRNVILMLLSVEIMLNASGLAFVTAGARWQQADGQVMLVLVLAVAAVEVAIGLAIVLQIAHRMRTLDSDAVGRLKG